MKILLLGATGATGRLLAGQLIEQNHLLKVIVRSANRLPESIRENPNLDIITESILEMNPAQLADIVEDCEAVACCLGHNVTLEGIFGHPRKLVRDAVQLICQAILKNAPEVPVKFVLMNTVGNRNRNLDEPISLNDRIILGLMRGLIPPQSDNEQAAEYLRVEVGPNDQHLEWAAVRPASLTDARESSEYEIQPSPAESAVFGKRQTSRINVADFMAGLITDSKLWNEWKGQMPVVYNCHTNQKFH